MVARNISGKNYFGVFSYKEWSVFCHGRDLCHVRERRGYFMKVVYLIINYFIY
jgi:hypothetical protein